MRTTMEQYKSKTQTLNKYLNIIFIFFLLWTNQTKTFKEEKYYEDLIKITFLIYSKAVSAEN